MANIIQKVADGAVGAFMGLGRAEAKLLGINLDKKNVAKQAHSGKRPDAMYQVPQNIAEAQEAKMSPLEREEAKKKREAEKKNRLFEEDSILNDMGQNFYMTDLTPEEAKNNVETANNDFLQQTDKLFQGENGKEMKDYVLKLKADMEKKAQGDEYKNRGIFGDQLFLDAVTRDEKLKGNQPLADSARKLLGSVKEVEDAAMVKQLKENSKLNIARFTGLVKG